MEVKIRSTQTKFLFFMLFIVLVLVSGKNSVSAAQSSGFFEYNTEKNGTVETAVITKYNGVESHVTIPEKINGFKVTGIGKNAFYKNLDLIKVTLPSSVKTINSYAFYKCSNLKTVNLEKVKIIGESAFESTILTVAKLSSVREIQKNAFAYCAELETINFGKQEMDSIDAGAFRGTAISTVSLNCKQFLESDYKNAYPYANGIFAYCENLTSVTIKTSGGKIGKAMFRDCTALKKVILDDTITRIGYAAFSGCTALKTIKLPSKLQQLDCDYGNGLLIFKGCTSLEEIEIPSGVQNLQLDNFFGCTSLKKVKLNEGLLYISHSGYNSNREDISHWNLEIPKTVVSINLGTVDAPNIIVPNSVTSFEPLSKYSNTGGKVFSYYKDSPMAAIFERYESTTALEPIPATSLKLNKTKLTMQAGTYEQPSTYRLKATLEPNNTTDAIKWTSTNTSIAEVDLLGNVTAKSAGMVVIRATSTTGLKADFTLTVKKGPSKITFDNDYNMTVGKGETFTKKATVDKEAYDKTITYESSDTSIATVSENGKVSALKEGIVTIKAVASNGLSKGYTVTVKKAPKKVYLDENIVIQVGVTIYLDVSLPEGTASYYKKYTSSNKKIATVDKNGMITAKKAGTVTITAKTFNDKTAKTKIKIVKK